MCGLKHINNQLRICLLKFEISQNLAQLPGVADPLKIRDKQNLP